MTLRPKISCNIRPLLRTLSTLLIFNLYAAAQSKPAADLIINHAKIWTVDPARPEAQAVAILRDRIVAVGTDADVDAWRGPQTGIIDAGGKLVCFPALTTRTSTS